MSHLITFEPKIHRSDRKYPVEDVLALVIKESECGVGNDPELVGMYHFLQYDLVIIFDRAYSGCFKPAIIAADAVTYV